MSRLPPLQELQALHLSREGGVAALPGLRRPCEIQLDDCPPPERKALRVLLNQTLPCAVAPEQAGSSDRRYFLLELVFAEPGEALSYHIPEDAAPEALVRLWRQGGLG